MENRKMFKLKGEVTDIRSVFYSSPTGPRFLSRCSGPVSCWTTVGYMTGHFSWIYF